MTEYDEVNDSEFYEDYCQETPSEETSIKAKPSSNLWGLGGPA